MPDTPDTTTDAPEFPTVAYELLPGFNAFEFPGYDGTLIRIEGAGYSTSDPRIVAELDMQSHAVKRSK